MWVHGIKSIREQILLLRMFLHSDREARSFYKRQTGRVRDEDKKCVFSIKHDLQNEALHKLKKKNNFRETLFAISFFHTYLSVPMVSPEWKIISSKRYKLIDTLFKNKNKSRIHPFFGRTHSGHQLIIIINFKDFRCLELLKCLTLFVSYKSFSKLIFYVTICSEMRERWWLKSRKQKTLRVIWKGLK